MTSWGNNHYATEKNMAEHRRTLRAQAEAYRLNHRSRRAPTHHRVLAGLGDWLARWGGRLQRRYGDAAQPRPDKAVSTPVS